MRDRRVRFFFGVALVLVIATLAPARVSEFEVDVWVFASGGVEVQSGDYSLLEVLGQPVVGPATGGDFEVEAGFFNEDSTNVPVELQTFTVE